MSRKKRESLGCSPLYLMPVHTISLTKKTDIAEGTTLFHFKKPDGFTFRAGQFVELTLVNPPETDGEGNTRAFTIAAAPSENELLVATRMRDTAFKRVLKVATVDIEAKIEGPFGALTLHENIKRPAVFIAGGIGITPFRSMAIEAARQKLPHTISLFFSNRRPEDAPFLDELAALEKENPNYKFIPTMTDIQASRDPWSGERGRIDAAMLQRHLAGLEGGIYYVAGPPPMVAATWQMLKAAGISGDDIRTEEFPWY